MMRLTIKKKYLRRLLAASVGLAASASLLAATGNIGGTGAVIVAMVETTQMSFGSIFATGNNLTNADVNGGGSILGVAQPANSAYIDLALDGTLSSTNGSSAALSELVPTGTPAVFDITAAASTQVRFTSNVIKDADSTATTVNIISGGPSGDFFIFTDLIMDTNGDNASDNDAVGDGFNATVFGTTDGAGALSVTAAGRLYTAYIGAANNDVYETETYSGTYNLIVSY